MQRNSLVFVGFLIFALAVMCPVAAAGSPGGILMIMDTTESGPVVHSVPVDGAYPPAAGAPEAPSAAGAGLETSTLSPGQSLQAAVDAAADGETIFLDPGTYYEHDITIAKNLVLKANTSAGGSRDNTIIDAQQLSRIFTISGAYAITIENMTLQNATALRGGAIDAPLGGTLTIHSSAFADCNASMYGGAIYSAGDGRVVVTSTTFSRCSAYLGGAILIFDRSSLTVTHSRFAGCQAYNAGAINVNNQAGPVTVSSSVFSDCTGTAGGAMVTFSTPLTVRDSSINNCTAVSGGAIAVQDTISLSGSTITGCSSDGDGGAILELGAGNVTVNATTIAGCTAGGYGGAIRSYAGNVTVENAAAIANCSAQYGGAIASSAGTITIRNTSAIAGCTATGNGGAIWSTGSAVTVTGSAITGSSAMDGGAIWSLAPLTITSSRLTNNTATRNGGAVNSKLGLSITSSTLTGNTATDGGAVYMTGSGTIRFSRFYQNTADIGPAISVPGDVNAINNWWGTNNGPSGQVLGWYTGTPWLVLGASSTPAATTTRRTSVIMASLTTNSAGDDTAAGGIFVPDGIPGAFAMVSGSGSVSPLANGSVNGIAATTFTPRYGEIVNISATVDDTTVYLEVPVYQAPPAPTGITPASGINTSAVAITNLSGSSFTPYSQTAVYLAREGHDSIAATGVTVIDNTRITCTLPIAGAEAGVWDVVVVNPDARDGVLPGAFTITAPVPAPAKTPVPTYNPYDTGETHGDFPSSPANPLMTVTVNIGGDSKAWQAVVTGTGLRDLIVTGTVQAGAGDNRTAPPGTVYQYLGLVPARFTGITNAVIHFTVPQAWLDEHRIAPGSIVLYHQTATGWEALPTTMLSAKDGTVYFSAQSNGFSSFAIAGTPAEPAAVTAVATQEIISTPEPQQTPAPAAVAKEPVTTRTTAPPATTPQPAASSPLVNIVLVIAAISVLAGGGWYARRLWIRRQNPALFEES